MATVIIPARWASTRFPGKPLTPLQGKPLILHVWERCCLAKSIRRVIIATDDFRIAEVAFDAGAEVALTKPTHPSGTDRVAEVALRLPREAIIVNVQGDEPFVEPSLIDNLTTTLSENRRLDMATAANPITDPADLADPNVVKVVLTLSGDALYFSRAPIPIDRDHATHAAALRHHGIYAYRRTFLLKLVRQKPTPLETLEKLEQLRALEHGHPIRVILTQPTPPGIDTPAQAQAAERFLDSQPGLTRTALPIKTPPQPKSPTHQGKSAKLTK